MPERLTTQTISVDQRQRLLSALPCFSTFSAAEMLALAAVMDEMVFSPGETIVEQDALIKCIYFIIDGQAEVAHAETKTNKLTHKVKTIWTPIATLNPGEAIGLSDTGFYSTTGKRTATVTALSTMHLLYLDLEKFNLFFQQYPHLRSDMSAAAKTMLRMSLIKQSLPFSRLSHERLQWLASKIEEIAFSKGTVIFQQNDKGDCCYLIFSGQVEILAIEENGENHPLAMLKPPMLFGEATFITHAPRNATARAVSDCQLLMLPYEYLTELFETENNVADMFMTLMVDRSRPIQAPTITEHKRMTADKQEIVILKNPDNEHYFKLSKEGWFIWQQLDGKQTMQEITFNLAEKYNLFAPDIVAALISKLARGGFILNLEINDPVQNANKPMWVRAMLRMRRILEARIAIGDADKWLSSIYKHVAYLFFTRLGKSIVVLVMLAGLLSFAWVTPPILSSFKNTQDTLFLLILLIPMTIVSIVLHELGHALATKACGFEVHYMGVGWYWFGPVAFTDTSDMWLGDRWPRVMVNLAGVFADLLTAGVSALLIFIVTNVYIQCFLWLFSLYTYVNAFRMLSPLQDLDGYYVLMDLFERPRLRRSAVIWLVKGLPRAFRQPYALRDHLPEGWYWIACIIFLILVSALTLLIQGFIFKILGIHVANPAMSLLLPFVIVIFSSLGIIADIRSQAE